ncbi:hypothetical protein [Paraflavitalea speifideaquila]|uniref:hypothetical protein n=1 Tax=Paraflavitalea speifideaquila TaxID=3076558 RepID=UPI0028E877EF|nr:hypothetical protein [Paraflavitalea speifideiaquila]
MFVDKRSLSGDIGRSGATGRTKLVYLYGREVMNKYPFIFSDKPYYRIRRHLVFWTFWWLFQGFLYAFTPSTISVNYMAKIPYSMVESIIYLIAHMFLAYSLMYFVLPRYLLKGKYAMTVIWVLVLFLATAAISSLIALYVIDPLRDWLLPQTLQPSKSSAPQVFIWAYWLACVEPSPSAVWLQPSSS